MELYPPNFAEFPSLSMSSSARVSARAPAWCNCTSSRQHVPIAAWAIFGFQKMTGSPIDFKEKWPKNDLPEKCLMCGYRSLLVQVPKKMGRCTAEKEGAWQWMSWAESCAAPFRWTSCPGDPQVSGKDQKKRLEYFIELDDGKIYKKALYLMVKTMVSCRFSLKPIQWILNGYEWIWMANG